MRRQHKRIKKGTKLIKSARVVLTLAYRDEYRKKWRKKEKVYIQMSEWSKYGGFSAIKNEERGNPVLWSE